MHHAIVIPAYNEARTIHAIAQRALRQCPDVIVVDDGSTDGTSAALADLPVILLRHEANQGKGAALWDGFVQALALGADAVVTVDGDGQHQPEDFARLALAAAAHPHCLIIGARMRSRESAPRARQVANRIADFWLGWAAGHAVADSQSGQRLYPATLLKQVSLRHDDKTRFAFESDLLIRAAKLGYPTVAVPIETVYDPAARPSHFRPVRDIARIARVVAGHLFASRFNLSGLRRSLRTAPCIVPDQDDSVASPSGVRSIAASRIWRS
jgi:glycosyltransferase involved in cell wall biosynthesis